MATPAVNAQDLVRSLQQVLRQVHQATGSDVKITDGKTELSRQDWITTAEATQRAVSTLTEERLEIEKLVMALRYRVQNLEETAVPNLEQSVLDLVRGEKYQQLFPNGHAVEFERSQIHHLCTKYPNYAQKLLDPAYEGWALEFFEFSIKAPSLSSYRNLSKTHWVDILVQFNDVAKQLMRAHLHEKLGEFPDHIEIRVHKGVCLKIELDTGVRWVPMNCWNEKICLKNRTFNAPSGAAGVTLSLEEIFKKFESGSPDLTVGMNGIINLNSALLQSKNDKGTVDRIEIDPDNKWINHKPYIEISIPELRRWYPKLGDPPPPFIMVLRAALGQNGEPHCDLVMLHKQSGNYQVIAINSNKPPGTAFCKEKMVSYPLTEEQGKMVIQRVGDDIKKSRELADKGKVPPGIDIGSYIDEILGHAFYLRLETLAHTFLNPTGKTPIEHTLANARKSLDTIGFEKFMIPVIDKLVEQHLVPEIHKLIVSSLETLNLLLQKNGEDSPLPLEDVRNAFEKHYQSDAPKIKESLLSLTRLCFEALHPYRMKVADAEQGTFLVGHLFRAANAIPWKWLRDLLNDFLLLILGPIRQYRYVKPEATSLLSVKGISRKVQSLLPERYINRQSQLFISLSEENENRLFAEIKTKMIVLAPNN